MSITRAQASPDTLALAEDLRPESPMTNEEAWGIIEAKLDEVRADEYDTGREAGYEAGYEAAELAAAEEDE